MAVITPPTIVAAPTPPDRGDRSTFSARATASFDHLKNHAIPEIQAVAENVALNATDAATSATSAAAQVGLATDQAVIAAGLKDICEDFANAEMWVSGTTYAMGDLRWSPANLKTYRRKTAGAGATDPSLDATNWVLAPSSVADQSGKAGKFLCTDGTDTRWVDRGLVCGDVISSASPLATPGYIPANGDCYLQSSYPDLFTLFPNQKDFSPAITLADPAAAGGGEGCTISADGVYVVVTHSASPYVTIYKRSGDALSKLGGLGTNPGGSCTGSSFSSDGTYLAVASSATPFILIYKRSGDTFTKLTNPATLPGNGQGCAFSPDGIHLAVADAGSPYLIIYKRSGDTFTKLTNPASLPGGQASCCAFSPDGTYLAVGGTSSPFIFIYKRSGDTFTRLADPAILPGGTINALAFSPDGTYLATAQQVSGNSCVVYQRAGDVFSWFTAYNGLNYTTGVRFSSDGKFMSLGIQAAPYLVIFDWSAAALNPIFPSLDQAISAQPNDTCFSPDGEHLVVPFSTTPYLRMYKRAPFDTRTLFKIPSLTQQAGAPTYLKTGVES